MNLCANLLDRFLENAVRGRISNHQGGERLAMRFEFLAQDHPNRYLLTNRIPPGLLAGPPSSRWRDLFHELRLE